VVEQGDGARVLVTLEGRMQAGVDAAAVRLVQLLPDGCSVLGQHQNVSLLSGMPPAEPSND
jgi:hypothetical protein